MAFSSFLLWFYLAYEVLYQRRKRSQYVNDDMGKGIVILDQKGYHADYIWFLKIVCIVYFDAIAGSPKNGAKTSYLPVRQHPSRSKIEGAKYS